MKLAALARLDDAQGWARKLSRQSLATMAQVEELLHDADDGSASGAHRKEQLELCIAELGECEAVAWRIMQSGETSLVAAFA